MRLAVAKVMRGSSAIWLWPIWHELFLAEDPDLPAPDQSGGSADATIGDNVRSANPCPGRN